MANQHPPLFTQRVVVYISPDDEAEVQQICAQTGMKMAAYMRTLLRRDLEARRGAPPAAAESP